MELSARQLKRVLVFLKDGRYTALVKGFLKLQSGQQDRLNHPQILTLAVFDWLEHLGCVDADMQRQIVTNFTAQIAEAARYGIPPTETTLPPVLISIGDGRFVTSTGRDVWFDLQADGWLVRLPAPVVTWLICDLTALALRLGTRLIEHYGGKDGQHRQHPGTADIDDGDAPGRPSE